MYLTLHTQERLDTMLRKSTKHLRDNGMSYFEHMKFAQSNGIQLIFAGCLLIIHSFIPAFFAKTGANITNKLNKVFTDQNEYLSLKTRVEAFKKIVYHYRSLAEQK